MMLKRDFLVVGLALAIALSLYLLSFRDLMAAAPAPADISRPADYVGHL